ncbi:unnamed protein product [Protopolystoma xenopodis]|uniref:Uncharacterized protein n=1 Tax=Protopolystoma xenopodis TaxID=117903 RepID=A0A448WU55_9PLAT|nr:unnamed protein product [Protopolystoma xenopodis]
MSQNYAPSSFASPFVALAISGSGRRLYEKRNPGRRPAGVSGGLVVGDHPPAISEQPTPTGSTVSLVTIGADDQAGGNGVGLQPATKWTGQTASPGLPGFSGPGYMSQIGRSEEFYSRPEGPRKNRVRSEGQVITSKHAHIHPLVQVARHICVHSPLFFHPST